MNRISALALCLLLSALPLTAQRAPLPTTDEEARELAATITPADLRRHLTILSADDMEGRETGEPGQKKAAAYLRSQLEALGFPAIGEEDGYFQTIKFSRQKWEEISLTLHGKELRHLWEFYAAPSRNDSREAVRIGEITFLGYGIDDEGYSDYRDRDVSGKTILIFAGEPRDRNGRFILTGTKDPSTWSLDNARKLQLARERGVETVLIIDPAFKQNVQEVRKETLDGRMRMAERTEAERREANHVYITPTLARELLGDDYRKVIKARKKIEKSGRSRPVTVATDMVLTQRKAVTELIGENVLGFLEGTDSVLKREILVVSAHYDHIGRRGDAIFNGADDNGSGTSTVLEIAEAFVQAKREGKGPRRSVLFLWVSGEEKGLLGSEYYATHPVFPLEQTIADINVDMVGRVDPKHAGNPYYIYVIGSDRLSSEMHRINETVNRDFTQLELDYTYNAEDDPNRYYYRSDHYNFARNGIPSIFFFNGSHADYHRDTDTIEKINFEKMARIGHLVFYNAWQLANQDKRIEVDVK
ncbi:M28 family peptidase [Lewinella sp. JB7]|uniref:M28 family peptidase n=1 Tax=Lewinella sp. JB7 TaxID=2962887 RepID=UPI0020C9A88E|nr:M28 family peptidase [Lewinella sp. JB7]MCP9235632.1 M28 family peptidase [Lewinella sp. JB7]